MYVRSQFSFQFSFFYRGNKSLTAVASLHRADVFRVRLGGHCREFGVKSCSNSAPISALGEVNAPFETQISRNSYYIFRTFLSPCGRRDEVAEGPRSGSSIATRRGLMQGPIKSASIGSTEWE